MGEPCKCKTHTHTNTSERLVSAAAARLICIQATSFVRWSSWGRSSPRDTSPAAAAKAGPWRKLLRGPLGDRLKQWQKRQQQQPNNNNNIAHDTARVATRKHVIIFCCLSLQLACLLPIQTLRQQDTGAPPALLAALVFGQPEKTPRPHTKQLHSGWLNRL